MKNFNYKFLCWVAAFLFVGFGSVKAQGTTCATATSIACGQTKTGSNVGVAVSPTPGFCSTSPGSFGVWYKFTGNGNPVTMTTCNASTNFDTKLLVYSGSCTSLSCVTGNDDMSGCSFGSLRSSVTFTSVNGQTYYVLVTGFGSATGTFGLTVSCATPVGNDACAGAIPVACGGSVSGSTANATVDAVGTCVTSNTAPGVWYSVVGTGGIMEATTCDAGTNYDTKLSVFTGSCSSLSCVTGNDDDSGCSLSSLRSTVSWNSVAGQTYRILVHGFSSATGNFTLSVSCPTPPANDNACNAQAVGLGSTNFSNEYAGAQAGEVSPGAGTGGSTCDSQDGWCSFETTVQNSVWFTFQAPASGCVTINANGFDSQLAVYEVGNCADFNTYTELAANDDGGPGLYAQITELSCLTAGATYYIQVDGYSGATTSNGTLVITDCGGAPLAVSAGDCQTRFVGYAPAEADTNFLYATATGGLAPYTYSWSPAGLFSTTINAGATGVLAVQPSATTTYTVTVTDARGCSASATVEVQVYDLNAPCAGNGTKVQVCHVPPGNPANAHEICIAASAVATHLAHGDRLGSCSNVCTATNASVVAPPACVDLTINLNTDRYGSETSWELVDVTNNVVIDSRASSTLPSSATLSDTYCVDPRNCYEFRINDSFGDGICCAYGTGSYSISFNGAVVASSSQSSNPFNGSSRTESFGSCASNKGATSNGAEGVMENLSMITAYPNPSTGFTNFKFMVGQSGTTTVKVYSSTGMEVATLFDGNAEKGQTYVVDFNGSDLATGLYLYRMVGQNGQVQIGKLYIAR